MVGSRAFGLLILTMVIAATGGAAAVAGDAPTAAVRLGADWQAEYVGGDVCIECHDDIGEALRGSPHHPDYGVVVPGTTITSCEACHGPGGQHVDEGGDGPILGPDRLHGLDAEESESLCLQCHATLHADWAGVEHADAGVECARCHVDQVHWDMPRLEPVNAFRQQSEFCLQCHPGAAAEFRLSFRHPVLEGRMECTDCHFPHGDRQGQTLLISENAPCLRCHTEVSGPFVFEHEATVGEECTACHRPHGSPNRRLLTQDGNSLCLHCHYEPGFPVLGTVDHSAYLSQRAACFDCHAEIHGSNGNEYFLKP
jgi:DmsE family decaheme c-type cytochrome